MYSLVKSRSLQDLLRVELVPFIVALLVAQIYFKWGSFALELVGFIVLWMVLGFIADVISRSLKR